MIQDERIRPLNEPGARAGRYVLYWMQQAQRASCNHALEYAVHRADELGLPVLAVFGLTQRFPEANLRHYRFMLEGLRGTRERLAARGIRLVVLLSPPVDAVLSLVADAALVVADRGYLRIQREWRRRVAERAGAPVVQVESDVVVPVELVSDKEEYAARTIRPRIHEHLDDFLVPLEEAAPQRDSMDLGAAGVDPADLDALLDQVNINRSVPPSPAFRGGEEEAGRLLSEFIRSKLRRYDEGRNEPAGDWVSHMSPYLHFGQVSPLAVALAVNVAGESRANREAYLEELVVRRELSMNFCHFNPRYDEFLSLPDWAVETLRDQGGTRRRYVYSAAQFERAETHDPYWNAAQREMVVTGKMHNYMRMYWGKKILEWSEDPAEAFKLALDLNNKYELDGRDPNSYAGVAWCFGKHDRGWPAHPVYGTVRYMSAGGLERKFDMDAYIEKVNRAEEESR